MTTEESSNWILSHTPATFQASPDTINKIQQTFTSMGPQKMVQSNYSYGLERDEAELRRNDGDHTKWSNPLEVRCVITEPP